MTKNQIEYAKLQETKRSNLANEAITSLRDTRSHTLGLAQLKETARHQGSVESETKRHNQAVEQAALVELGIKATDAATREASQREAQRHNLASEELSKRDLQIKSDHNIRTALETHRSNVAKEELSRDQHWENVRHNVAQEGAANVSNQIKQQEADIKLFDSASQDTYRRGQTEIGTNKNKIEAGKLAKDTILGRSGVIDVILNLFQPNEDKKTKK